MNYFEENPRYLDVRELADHIHCTVGTVRVKTSRQEIPHIKLGRRVLFNRKEIDAWLITQKVLAECDRGEQE